MVRIIVPSESSSDLTVAGDGSLTFLGKPFPELIIAQGPKAVHRFIEFFAANIRSHNTRQAYAQAVSRLLEWCDNRNVSLNEITSITVAQYTEDHSGSDSTIKQHLAAIRGFFDWMTSGGIVPLNPAAPIRGPRHVVSRGKTPALPAEEARNLLDTIDTSHVVGMRDRAIIAVMVYSFARVSAVVGMKVFDYYRDGQMSWIRLHEKGGKFHVVPVHHRAERYLDEYLDSAGIRDQDKSPLFRSVRGRIRSLTDRSMHRMDVLRMIKRRARDAGITMPICCHSFRATGITAYLENGGTLEKAQSIAAHESPRTTKLYDRSMDSVTIEEIERIRL
jgi:integrase/recombinase XerD